MTAEPMTFKEKIRTLQFGVRVDRKDGDRAYVEDLRERVPQVASYAEGDHRLRVLEGEHGERGGLEVDHRSGRVDAFATPEPARMRLSLSGKDE